MLQESSGSRVQSFEAWTKAKAIQPLNPVAFCISSRPRLTDELLKAEFLVLLLPVLSLML